MSAAGPPEEGHNGEGLEEMHLLFEDGVAGGYMISPRHHGIHVEAEGEAMSPAWNLGLAKAAHRALIAGGFEDDAAQMTFEVMTAQDGHEFLAVMSYVEISWP